MQTIAIENQRIDGGTGVFFSLSPVCVMLPDADAG